MTEYVKATPISSDIKFPNPETKYDIDMQLALQDYFNQIYNALNNTEEVDSDFVTGPSSATDNSIATFDGTTGDVIQDGGSTIANVLDRTNHTGTQEASTISDFDTEVGNNTDVAANTAARHSECIMDFDTWSGTQSIGTSWTDITNISISYTAPKTGYMVIIGRTQGKCASSGAPYWQIRITEDGSQLGNISTGAGDPDNTFNTLTVLYAQAVTKNDTGTYKLQSYSTTASATLSNADLCIITL